MHIGVNRPIGFGQIRRNSRGKSAASVLAGQAPSKRPPGGQTTRGLGMTLQDIGMPLPTEAELAEMQAWVDREFDQAKLPTWKSLRS